MATFKVGGVWDAHQGNGFALTFALKQTGTTFVGTASHSGGKVTGQVEGSVRGDQFIAAVKWNGGPLGEYNGTFNTIGRITGMTFDMAHPESQATWFSQKVFSKS